MAHQGLSIVLLAAIAATGTSLVTHSRSTDASAPPRCAALEDVDFATIPDAPTQLTGAQVRNDSTETPPTCEVSGYISKSIGFQLALPDQDWNGKFLQLGCGGFCGAADLGACDAAVRRGYACAVSDMGHRSTFRDALWAYNNLEAEVDHGYRATHVTALASKTIVERYYGRAPQRSYFMGSSTGGRQAMMEAQRFPWDFDGIVAGVPSLSVAGIHMNLLWANRSMVNSAGEPLFTQSDLDLLHRAVVAKCDLNDGIADGVIGDPRLCSFEPSELRCGAGKQQECLTTLQVEAARRIYGGPVTSQGKPIYMPGALKGSEQTWLDWFTGLARGNRRATYNFVREEFRYAAFLPDPGPMWKPEDFDFNRDFRRLDMTEALSAAVNPDLRRFKAAGGKLLVFAGWSDAAGMPLHTVDYYEAAERSMGGRAAVQEFLRLFMIPGMHHDLGEGAFAVDWLSYLERWVETDVAPDQVLSSHVETSDLDGLEPDAYYRGLLRRLQFPLDPARVRFTRPVYPYPTSARYSGRGDPNSAANFLPVDAEASGAIAPRTTLRSGAE